jgi:palmitoyltransferase
MFNFDKTSSVSSLLEEPKNEDKSVNSENHSLNSHSNEDDLSYHKEEYTENERILMRVEAFDNVQKHENLRYCSKCQYFKPLRTHHCRLCMRCVLKMDHHCQWMVTCIGFGNYKYFMNVLFYTDMSLFFIGSMLIRFMRD